MKKTNVDVKMDKDWEWFDNFSDSISKKQSDLKSDELNNTKTTTKVKELEPEESDSEYDGEDRPEYYTNDELLNLPRPSDCIRKWKRWGKRKDEFSNVNFGAIDFDCFGEYCRWFDENGDLCRDFFYNFHMENKDIKDYEHLQDGNGIFCVHAEEQCFVTYEKKQFLINKNRKVNDEFKDNFLRVKYDKRKKRAREWIRSLSENDKQKLKIENGKYAIFFKDGTFLDSYTNCECAAYAAQLIEGFYVFHSDFLFEYKRVMFKKNRNYSGSSTVASSFAPCS